MEFTVKIVAGYMFINGELVSRECFDNESVGIAVEEWLNDCDAEYANENY